MNKKRDLLKELNITQNSDNTPSPLDVDIKKIKAMVNNKIDSAYTERKISIMKSKKKFALIAAAATLVLGITVFAASGIITGWYSHSSSIPEYTSLPSEEQCIDDFGYAPALVDTFDNGYAFKNGSIIDNALHDDSNNSVEEFKSVTFRYEKDGDEVIFSQDKYYSLIESHGDIITSVDGIDVYYYSYMNKVVPSDYQLTDEDKKAEKNGELIFSYGSETVEVIKVQSVSWTDNGIHYNMLQIDGKLSPEDLVGMAAEVIAE